MRDKTSLDCLTETIGRNMNVKDTSVEVLEEMSVMLLKTEGEVILVDKVPENLAKLFFVVRWKVVLVNDKCGI